MIADLFVPVVTPFGADGGVDVGALAAHAAWVLEQGASGVLLFGTTGEGPSLGVADKLDTARAVAAELSAGRVLAAVTENSVSEARRCLSGYGELGLGGALVLPPTYFREPSGDGVTRFFEVVLDTPDLPVLAYHIPGLAPAVPIDTVGGLDTVWGVKDSGGDMTYTRALIGTGKAVLVGAEATVAEALRAGAVGTIAGMGNVLPAQLAAVCAAVRAGDDAAADAALAHVLHVQAAILAAAPGMEWIAAFKQLAAHLHGVDLGAVRAPLLRRRDYLTPEVLDRLAESPASAAR